MPQYDEASDSDGEEASPASAKAPVKKALLLGGLAGATLASGVFGALMMAGKLHWADNEPTPVTAPKGSPSGGYYASPAMVDVAKQQVDNLDKTLAAIETSPGLADSAVVPNVNVMECKDWCPTLNESWPEKCALQTGACSSCAECDAVVQPLQGSCYDWCKVNALAWDKKCLQDGCKACEECHRRLLTPPAGEVTTRGGPVLPNEGTPRGYKVHKKGVCWVGPNIDSDYSAPENMKLSDCAMRCNSVSYCGCFMYQKFDPVHPTWFKGKCWMEQHCDFKWCAYKDGSVDTYLRTR